MQTILLTGATGEIGSQLAKRLSQQGFKVCCMVRSKNKLNARERLLASVGKDVEVLEADLSLPLCGFDTAMIETFRHRFSKFIHCAALVKFDKSLEQQIMDTNVLGTNRALELAQVLNIPEFHYVSTAYVAGAASNLSEWNHGLPENARNPYELSKQKAEQLVRAWSGKTAIYRLSIVVGDSYTGLTDSYNGFYGYLSGFWQIREQLKAATRPFFVPANTDSTMNLVPRDWVTDMLAKLMRVPVQKKTYHLTHPQPANIAWMMTTSFEYLGLPVRGTSKGFEIEDYCKKFSEYDLSWYRLQMLILRSLKRYAVYTEHEARFGHEELKRTLGYAYSPPRAITQPFLELLLDYATGQNFSAEFCPKPSPIGKNAQISDQLITREALS